MVLVQCQPHQCVRLGQIDPELRSAAHQMPLVAALRRRSERSSSGLSLSSLICRCSERICRASTFAPRSAIFASMASRVQPTSTIPSESGGFALDHHAA